MNKKFKRLLALLGIITVAVAIIAAIRSEKGFVLNGFSANNFNSVSLSELKNDGRVTFNNSLMLVNSEHPLPDNFTADIKRFEDTDVYLDSSAVDSFSIIREAVNQKFGKKLLITSSYRSTDDQKLIYESEGKKLAAVPGTSEHETGLGIDVYVKYFAGKGFIKSDEGKFVNEYCGEYGFIIRYPKYRKHITGYSYEPWHIRYVGKPHAKIISDNDITLEEYLDSLKPGKFYLYDGYVISKQNGDTLKIPESFKFAVVSPDNCGNYIVTVKL